MLRTLPYYCRALPSCDVRLPYICSLNKTQVREPLETCRQLFKELAYQFKYADSSCKNEADILKSSLHYNDLKAFKCFHLVNAFTIEFDQAAPFINQFVVGVGGLLNQPAIQAKDLGAQDLYNAKQFHAENSTSLPFSNTLLVNPSLQKSDYIIIRIADNEIIYRFLSDKEKTYLETHEICIKRYGQQNKSEPPIYQGPALIRGNQTTKFMVDFNRMESIDLEMKLILEKVRKIAEAIATPIYLENDSTLTVINADRTLYQIDSSGLRSPESKIERWTLKKN